jgi:hypothetical protein
MTDGSAVDEPVLARPATGAGDGSPFEGAERQVVGMLSVPKWQPGMEASVLPWGYQDILEVVDDAPGALKSSKNDAVAELRARVLADVEAKRRLLGWATEPPRLPAGGDLSRWQARARDLVVDTAAAMRLDRRRPVIDCLVAAYADHPDFHPEWKLIEVDQYEPGDDKPSTRARGRTV